MLSKDELMIFDFKKGFNNLSRGYTKGLSPDMAYGMEFNLTFSSDFDFDSYGHLGGLNNIRINWWHDTLTVLIEDTTHPVEHFKIEAGKRYSIKLWVQKNTLGHQDGIVKLRVDGKPFLVVDNVEFTPGKEFHVDEQTVHAYFETHCSRDCWIRFEEIISKPIKRVPIGVLTHNRKDLLRQTLGSLHRTLLPTGTDISIISDGCQGQHLEYLRMLANVIYGGGRRGVVKASFFALQHLLKDNDWCLLVQDDVLFTSNWYPRMIDNGIPHWDLLSGCYIRESDSDDEAYEKPGGRVEYIQPIFAGLTTAQVLLVSKRLLHSCDDIPNTTNSFDRYLGVKAAKAGYQAGILWPNVVEHTGTQSLVRPEKQWKKGRGSRFIKEKDLLR